MKSWFIARASESACSSTFFERGVNAIRPVGNRLVSADELHRAGTDVLEREPEAPQCARRDARVLSDEPDQEVLGADPVVPEGTRFVLREDDGLPRRRREPHEHRAQRD
jgi:hypothetical protein